MERISKGLSSISFLTDLRNISLPILENMKNHLVVSRAGSYNELQSPWSNISESFYIDTFLSSEKQRNNTSHGICGFANESNTCSLQHKCIKELSLHSNLSGYCNPQINARFLPVCGLLLQNVHVRGAFFFSRRCQATLPTFHLRFMVGLGIPLLSILSQHLFQDNLHPPVSPSTKVDVLPKN